MSVDPSVQWDALFNTRYPAAKLPPAYQGVIGFYPDGEVRLVFCASGSFVHGVKWYDAINVDPSVSLIRVKSPLEWCFKTKR